jgi:hypothetical protein
MEYLNIHDFPVENRIISPVFYISKIEKVYPKLLKITTHKLKEYSIEPGIFKTLLTNTVLKKTKKENLHSNRVQVYLSNYLES